MPERNARGPVRALLLQYAVLSVGGADWRGPMCSDSVSLTYLASDIALEFSSFLNANEEYQFLGALLRQLTRHSSIIAENFI